ncbi:hypothetical protein V1477_018807 [Vespula maculifrons]|uniref:Uncharacterized protein n=1 Tax=Vespula maculifrons TaxID=7453 RepID=A0ABD2AWG0_VESMC
MQNNVHYNILDLQFQMYIKSNFLTISGLLSSIKSKSILKLLDLCSGFSKSVLDNTPILKRLDFNISSRHAISSTVDTASPFSLFKLVKNKLNLYTSKINTCINSDHTTITKHVLQCICVGSSIFKITKLLIMQYMSLEILPSYVNKFKKF